MKEKWVAFTEKHAEIWKFIKFTFTGASTSVLELAVHPAFAVISVGADNDYGHPAQKTLSRLEAQDIQILRTDLSGTITAYSTPDTLTWSTGR